MKVLEHPDIWSVDMKVIAKELQDPVAMVDFIDSYNSAVKNIIKNPCPPSNALNRSLTGWYKEKFHKEIPPPSGQNPQYRIIYQLSKDQTKIRILVVARRIDDKANNHQKVLPDGTVQQDGYQVAAFRPKNANYQKKK
ncbi:hypothetical protein M0L17_11930 [Bacillaceae bacterium OS4b]|nr:hypothetical protein [Bacillaceae bacterium OS4b]